MSSPNVDSSLAKNQDGGNRSDASAPLLTADPGSGDGALDPTVHANAEADETSSASDVASMSTESDPESDASMSTESEEAVEDPAEAAVPAELASEWDATFYSPEHFLVGLPRKAMTIKPGFYSFDSDLKMHMVKGNYHGGEYGDVKIEKLLEKGAGALRNVFGTSIPMSQLMQWFPKHQSAFDALRPRLQDIWGISVNGITVNKRIHCSRLSQDIGFTALMTRYCCTTIDLLLYTGINEENALQTRWAAARGPWPQKTHRNMSYEELKPCMKAVFHKLVDMLDFLFKTEARHWTKDQQRNTWDFVMSDLSRFLSYSWHSVGAWQDFQLRKAGLFEPS